MNIELDLKQSLKLPVAYQTAESLLHDLEATLGRFPNLKKLTRLDELSYFWEMRTMGVQTAKIAHDVSYGARYTIDIERGRLSWEPIPGKGNALIGGSLELKAAGDATELTFKASGLLKDVPVPLVYRAFAPAFISSKFSQMIERFLERCGEALAAAPAPAATKKKSGKT